MTKKKEPPQLPIHIEVPDDKGGKKWYTGTIALTDALIGELRNHLTLAPPPAHDYTAMKLEVMREAVKKLERFDSPLALRFTANGKQRVTQLHKCHVMHPDDYNAMQAKLAQIEKMEKEKTP